MQFDIACGPMPVRNTGWGITTDRMTDQLIGNVNCPDLPGWKVVFPQCRVTYQSPGHWQVEALTGTKQAKILDPGGVERGFVEYLVELVDRQGRLMIARKVDGSGMLSVNGREGTIVSSLPEVAADSFPWYRGGALAGYTVRACVCPGQITWNS